MTKSETQIKQEIKEFIKKNEGKYPDWYVGISENPEQRLEQHGVKDGYIYRTAESSEIARRIEEYFVEELGTDGGEGGGDEDAKSVYAYKKKTHTDP